MRPVTILTGSFLGFVCLFGCRTETVFEDDKPKLSDLTVVAQYAAGGLSDWKSWKYTITGDGEVVQEIYDYPNTERKTSTLSSKDIQDLIAKVDEVEFDDLPGKKSYDVTDSSTLRVAITRNKKTHEVIVYAPGDLKDDKEVKRSLRVWAEILRKVPAPNREDKPEDWEPQPSTSGHPSSDPKAG